MTIKQIKQRFVLATVLLALASVGVLAWGVLSPVQVSGTGRSLDGATAGPGEGSDEKTQGVPTLQEARALGAINLRRPLRDPPPPPPPPPVPLKAKLLGTIYETQNPAQSMAMFKLADGSVQWIAAGQTFNDPVGAVQVLEIRDQAVKLKYRDQEHELAVGP